MTIIDPMYNLFLGTAKYILKVGLVTSKNFLIIQKCIDSMNVPIAFSFSAYHFKSWTNIILLDLPP